jgi:3',5'-cyclic AMP phosphodiesterase CpdA
MRKLILPAAWALAAMAAACSGRDYVRIVVVADPHLSVSSDTLKQRMRADINSWPDADILVVPGDICATIGTPEEYAAAKKFLGGFTMPAYLTAGNHEYIYGPISPQGRLTRGSPQQRRAKLKLYKKTFGTPLYYSRREGGYLLVFLSADSLEGGVLTEISDAQLRWLAAELAANSGVPAIIFFHSPLTGTLRAYHPDANTPNFVAEPQERLRAILKNNPQVFMWVSGHTHTATAEESFASPVNIYEGRVRVIHNPDMAQGFSNSLYLYADKVVVRTYDHNKGAWAEKFERTIQSPLD